MLDGNPFFMRNRMEVIRGVRMRLFENGVDEFGAPAILVENRSTMMSERGLLNR